MKELYKFMGSKRRKSSEDNFNSAVILLLEGPKTKSDLAAEIFGERRGKDGNKEMGPQLLRLERVIAGSKGKPNFFSISNADKRAKNVDLNWIYFLREWRKRLNERMIEMGKEIAKPADFDAFKEAYNKIPKRPGMSFGDANELAANPKVKINREIRAAMKIDLDKIMGIVKDNKLRAQVFHQRKAANLLPMPGIPSSADIFSIFSVLLFDALFTDISNDTRAMLGYFPPYVRQLKGSFLYYPWEKKLGKHEALTIAREELKDFYYWSLHPKLTKFFGSPDDKVVEKFLMEGIPTGLLDVDDTSWIAPATSIQIKEFYEHFGRAALLL